MLYCAVLYCVVVHCAVLLCSVLCYLHSMSFEDMSPCCTMLHCVAFTVLCIVVLCCIVFVVWLRASVLICARVCMRVRVCVL